MKCKKYSQKMHVSLLYNTCVCGGINKSIGNWAWAGGGITFTLELDFFKPTRIKSGLSDNSSAFGAVSTGNNGAI